MRFSLYETRFMAVQKQDNPQMQLLFLCEFRLFCPENRGNIDIFCIFQFCSFEVQIGENPVFAKARADGSKNTFVKSKKMSKNQLHLLYFGV